jgi:hypothetical protein
MNTPRRSMRLDKIALIVALPVAVSLAGVAWIAAAQKADEPKAPEPPGEVASPQDPGRQVPSAPAGGPAGTEGSTAPAAAAVQEEAAVEAVVESADEATGAGEAAAEGAAGETGLPEEAPEPAPEPITGAFGMSFGQVFEPGMVKEVLAEEEHSYRKGKDTEAMGKRYRFEPKVADPHFDAYSVSVNEDGVIYALEARHDPVEKTSACQVTKKLAGLLEEKYGRPRGRDPFGSWYVFRDMSSDQYRGVRLYAQKCRIGRYSIVYSDDAAKLGEDAPSAAEQGAETEGAPEATPPASEAEAEKGGEAAGS